eukprot:4008891-Prymnesium_polylepis.1
MAHGSGACGEHGDERGRTWVTVSCARDGAKRPRRFVVSAGVRGRAHPIAGGFKGLEEAKVGTQQRQHERLDAVIGQVGVDAIPAFEGRPEGGLVELCDGRRLCVGVVLEAAQVGRPHGGHDEQQRRALATPLELSDQLVGDEPAKAVAEEYVRQVERTKLLEPARQVGHELPHRGRLVLQHATVPARQLHGHQLDARRKVPLPAVEGPCAHARLGDANEAQPDRRAVFQRLAGPEAHAGRRRSHHGVQHLGA